VTSDADLAERISSCRRPNTIEESCSGAEGDWGNVGAQLLDETCGEVLVAAMHQITLNRP
jgi:hypothetical protein